MFSEIESHEWLSVGSKVAILFIVRVDRVVYRKYVVTPLDHLLGKGIMTNAAPSLTLS